MIRTVFALSLLCSSAAAQTYGPYPEQKYMTCGDTAAPVAAAIGHGGWNVGGSFNNASVQELCTYLGRHGVFAVAFNYRLAKVGQAWPAQWQDFQLMTRTLHSGYPRVVMIGLSAGAYDALGAGYQQTIAWPLTDPANESAMLPGYASRPDAIVDVSGFVDLMQPGLSQSAVNHITLGLHGAPADIPQLDPLALTSPVFLARADSPPTLIIDGANDDVVSPDQTTELYWQLKHIGARVGLYRHNGGHVFGGMTPAEKAHAFRLILDCVLGTASSVCSAASEGGA